MKPYRIIRISITGVSAVATLNTLTVDTVHIGSIWRLFHHWTIVVIDVAAAVVAIAIIIIIGGSSGRGSVILMMMRRRSIIRNLMGTHTRY